MSKEYLEAFKTIKIKCHPNSNPSPLVDEALDIVEQALIKAQEQEKVLKIVFEKRVDMWHLADLLEQTYEMYLAFCESEGYTKDYILIKKEFDLLKRWLG